MKNAETVTFGGSGLDRAAEIRSQSKELSSSLGAEFILFWRGKPLLKDDELYRVSFNHPVLADASGDNILLGRENEKVLFAANLDAWQPDNVDEAQLNQFLDPSVQEHPALPEADGFQELRRVMTKLSPRDAELAATGRALFEWHYSHKFCANCGAASDFAPGGWERSCPSCGRKHFPRTDPVVIMLITAGNKVLLGRSPGWPEGMFSLLAGFVEPGETLEAAVRREVFEEAGVQVGAVTYLASQPWPFPASLMFGCAGVAINEEINIDPVEIEDARWVTREELADVFAGQHPDILPARKGAIAHFLLEKWLADQLN